MGRLTFCSSEAESTSLLANIKIDYKTNICVIVPQIYVYVLLIGCLLSEVSEVVFIS